MPISMCNSCYEVLSVGSWCISILVALKLFILFHFFKLRLVCRTFQINVFLFPVADSAWQTVTGSRWNLLLRDCIHVFREGSPRITFVQTWKSKEGTGTRPCVSCDVGRMGYSLWDCNKETRAGGTFRWCRGGGAYMVSVLLGTFSHGPHQSPQGNSVSIFILILKIRKQRHREAQSSPCHLAGKR